MGQWELELTQSCFIITGRPSVCVVDRPQGARFFFLAQELFSVGGGQDTCAKILAQVGNLRCVTPYFHV